SSKFQAPKRWRGSPFWYLELGICLELGVWDLVFGTWFPDKSWLDKISRCQYRIQPTQSSHYEKTTRCPSPFVRRVFIQRRGCRQTRCPFRRQNVQRLERRHGQNLAR